MLTSIRKLEFSHSESATEIRRIEDTVSARLWLADGFPIADVLTLLEFRHRFRIMESRPAAERCRKRRRPENGTGNDVAPELLQRVAEAAKALETVSAPRPHG
jgi:hypothetical protein